MKTIATAVLENVSVRRHSNLNAKRAVKVALILGLALVNPSLASVHAATIVTVRPTEIDDVLSNPGIGFTTFQRFNGDRLNEGLKWTEGYPTFPLALRLKSATRAEVLVTAADITTWLPGDSLFDGSVAVPTNLPAGDYELELALLDPLSKTPKVRLAIEGRGEDGWYRLGTISVVPNASTKSP